jgi:hypothetical protein
VIAFYGKNSLPRDAVYREAVRARDEKRKAEEEARRRAAEAERGEEGTPEEAKVPPAPPFTLLYGPSLAISGQRRQHIPRGVGIHLHSPEIADLVGQSPRSRSATLEVIVDGVHRYRIQNVALKRASEGRILAVPRDIPTLLLELEDGIELRIDDERTLTMVQQFWRTD